MTESLFGRLYTYARSTAVEQLENFTTEALAAAVRSEPRLFLEILASRGALALVPNSRGALVSTQEVVPGVGIVDLVLRTFDGTSLSREIWIEVKVWAPESGDQLARYQRHLRERPDGSLCTLVTLGPRPLGQEAAIPWIPWQAVRDAVVHDSGCDPLWRELATFLEERNVADSSSEPISAREAASLLEAHSLFQKATRLLTDVNELGRTRWPVWAWGGKDQITQLILGQFQSKQRFTIKTGSSPIYLVLGLTDLGRTGEAHLTVWVESDPRKAVVRQQLLEAADAGGLGASWIRRLDTWQGLAKTQRAATVEGVTDTVAWFADRLDELEAARVPSVIA